MNDPRELPPRRTASLLHHLVRWLAALCIGLTVTGILFFVVMGIQIGPDTVRSLLRFFPLHAVALSQEDRCALGPRRMEEALQIEGSVGMLVGERFVGIDDAEVFGERLTAAEQWMAVEPGGVFRVVTALPKEGDEECELDAEGSPLPAPQLVFRAPGCAERRVPVVRPWIPRRILLSCPSRS